ncbi:Slit like 3 protein, partial [Pseudolycoriella hygida]
IIGCDFITVKQSYYLKIMIPKSLCLILFVAYAPNINVAHTHDCYYNEAQEHVEYNCDGPTGEHFDQRTSLRVLNISYFGFEAMPDKMLKDNILLERIDLSHNQLTEVPGKLFDTTPKLIEADFSFNQISRISPLALQNTISMKSLNLSFNKIDAIRASVFSNLPELEALDLSSNSIDVIDPDLFMYNRMLKTLNLNNNQLKQLDCEFLATLIENPSVNVYINTLEEVQTRCGFRFDLDILISPEETATHLQIIDSEYKWRFTEADFIKLRRMSFTSSENTNSIEMIAGVFPTLILND